MNAVRTLVDSPVIERLGWALLHSVWQGLAVATVLALCLPLLRRRSARASYGACCGALLLSVFLPAMTFCILPESQTPSSVPLASMPERSQPVAAEPTPAARPIPSMANVPLDDFARDGFDRARKEQSRTAPSAGQQASIAQPAKRISPSKSPAQASSPPPSFPAASWTDRGAALAQTSQSTVAMAGLDRSGLERGSVGTVALEPGRLVRGASAQSERNHSRPGRDPTSRSPYRRANRAHSRRAAVAVRPR